ncbi:MAG: DUF3604 domain-containing protein [Pseudomonadales bacterium]|nr:DUF3604 domain-containing protein [Pseudomonadales bacterium]
MKMKIFGAIIASFLSVSVLAQDVPIDRDTISSNLGERSYSPYADRNFPTELLWGEVHLHSNLSLDARAAGVILSPSDAYRFARGDEVTASGGFKVQLGTPLDFLVLTDHSDAMGAMNEVIRGNPNLMTDATVRDWNRRINLGGETAIDAAYEIVQAIANLEIPEILAEEAFARSVWEDYVQAAEDFNDPGTFTAMIGNEWTSFPGANNLHRNIVYRDGADKALQFLPYTTVDSENPEDLWTWMENYEASTGGQVLAAAHNGNLSNGIMFPDINSFTGEPITADYAERRARWEPIYEVTQIKGDGEAHPFLSPTDEFADYETWDRSNLGPIAKEDEMLQYEYAREALKNGLRHEVNLGTNPYKFGLIGSTDSHTGLATAEEDNFFGKHSQTEPDAGRMDGEVGHFPPIVWPGWYQAASGYAAVWATENTRESIFDAMARKETYASTGTRLQVRFFGGWEFTEEDAITRLPGDVGYRKGVPMGGDLSDAPRGRSPSFLVAARKDPMSGNLDRIQIVKGWLNDDGETEEQVYDVVWSGDREPGRDGILPSVGNTVDVENASFTNSIGEPELITVWEDPDFDADQRAFYYARVIEIPTPRWTAYEANYFDVEAPAESPMITQERAYTSPIWYTP